MVRPTARQLRQGIETLMKVAEQGARVVRPAPTVIVGEPVGYGIEPDNLEKLEAIVKRLYDATTLSYDDRRDLAYRLSVVAAQARSFPIGEDK
jgi:hypothetical protein